MRFECFDVFSINVESTLVLQRMAIHTLVIDCDGRKRNNSHFTLEESVAAAKSLRAQKVFSATFICEPWFDQCSRILCPSSQTGLLRGHVVLSG